MVPDYQTLMLPVLKVAEKEEVRTADIVEVLSNQFDLSAEDREQILPSGQTRTIVNRIHWAKTYLKQAGLLNYPRRGVFIATDAGKAVLAASPERIDNKFLLQFKSFQSFRNRKNELASKMVVDEITNSTPDEDLRAAHERINAALSGEILDRVRDGTPMFFEKLIIELLVSMGYGGLSDNPGKALGRSGDGGIDGVIDQDPLGVDQIYVQAKRYAEANKIGSGSMRDFFGALNLKDAQKGIFFTTSNFSKSAIQTANDLSIRIVLIDGIRLANLMLKYNIGCRNEDVLYLKKIDEEFFDE